MAAACSAYCFLFSLKGNQDNDLRLKCHWAGSLEACSAAADIGDMPQPLALQQQSIKAFVKQLCV